MVIIFIVNSLPSAPPGRRSTKPALPAGEWHEDEFYGKSEIFRQRLTVPVTVKEADKEATLTVTWQGCADAGFCYPPETKVIPLSAVLAASNDAQPTAAAPVSSLNHRPAFNPQLPVEPRPMERTPCRRRLPWRRQQTSPLVRPSPPCGRC